MLFSNYAQTPGQLQKNGNISEIKWQVIGGDQYAVVYKYDNYNRLENSYSKNLTNNKLNEYNTSYDYDDRGNITNLTRRGMYPGSANLLSNQLDNLDYTPISGTNRIKKIEDNASTSLKKWAAKGSSNDFDYDDNGNMTIYPTKNAIIDYNHLNLPRRVTFDNGGTIEFTYDADGNQLRKEVKQGSTSLENRYYIGAAEYKDGALVQVMHDYGRVTKDIPCDQNQFIKAQLATDETYYGHHIISNSSVVPVGNTVFKAKEAIILNEEFTVSNGKVYEAFIEPCTGSWQYEYALKDHLGNTRVVFSEDGPDLGTDIDILQENHYYPFGMEMNGEWQNTYKHDYNYLYNGKELHKDFSFDMAAYGFRFYDPAIARFIGVDPISDQFPHVSTYNYAENKVPNGIDLHGLQFAPARGPNGEVDTKATAEQHLTSGRILSPIIAETAAGLSPAGPAIDVKDFAEASFKGDRTEMFFAGLGFAPGIGDFFKGVRKAFSKIFRSGDKGASGLGDLTKVEVNQIQEVVDEAGRPLEVVGSAAEGTRRNVGSNLPIGKGEGTKSDIDFLIPPSSKGHFRTLQLNLPGIDPKTGAIIGTHNPQIGPGVRFEPNVPPKKIE